MNPNDRGTQFLLTMIIAFGSLGVLILNDRLKRGRVRAAARAGKARPASRRDDDTSWGLVVTLVVGVPLFTYLNLFTDWFDPLFRRFIGGAGRILGWAAITVAAVAVFVLLFVVVKTLHRQWKSRHVRSAFRLAQSGDVPGAVAMLREKLHDDGPSAEVFNAIVLIYFNLNDWQNALRAIDEAEEHGVKSAELAGNKGFIFWKQGRVQEAGALLQEAHRALPTDLCAACYYGSVLTELGEKAKAAEVLQDAEHIFNHEYCLNADARRARRRMLDEFRQKVAATHL